jgi:hypothetical protein
MKKHNYSFITLLLTITLPLSPAASASSVWDPPYLVENAFVAGSDINDEPLYVCRTEVAIGKYNATYDTCFIPYGGRELETFDFEILMIQPDTEYEWILYSDSPPDNAIIGASDINGEPLYICSAEHQGRWIPGKFPVSHGVCYISFAELEIPISNFRLLTFITPISSSLNSEIKLLNFFANPLFSSLLIAIGILFIALTFVKPIPGIIGILFLASGVGLLYVNLSHKEGCLQLIRERKMMTWEVAEDSEMHNRGILYIQEINDETWLGTRITQFEDNSEVIVTGILTTETFTLIHPDEVQTWSGSCDQNTITGTVTTSHSSDSRFRMW